MILLDLSPSARAHLAVAIRRYHKQLRNACVPIPAELPALADALLAAPSSGQQRPPDEVPGNLVHPGLDGPLFVNTSTAAAMLSISPRTLGRWVAAGRVQAIGTGTGRRFPVEALREVASGGSSDRSVA